ncbi:MAG: CRTAC1 family protein, partial [Planctomycetota bacterium]
FLDLDVDGDQDLFVSNYIHWSPGAERLCRTTRGEPTYCSPNSYEDPARDSFLRNRGDGTFEDASVEIGLDKSYGNGFGIAWGRIDDRPGLDVYVANDGMANQLWSTAPDGTLVDRGPELGCALSGTGIPEAGMGVSMADVDHDGRWDLMLTHLEGETNTLYRGGRRGFRDASGQSGTTSASLARTGFGIGLVDFDHDGQLDLYIANGGVKYPGDPPDPTNRLAEPDQVFRGGAKGRFEVLPAEAIVQAEPFTTGRGAAFGDIDEDGDVDVVLNDMRGRLRILRNVAEKQGGAVTLSVLDRDGLPAVGAEVRYRLGDVAVLRQVQRTYSYCASNDPRVHVGLGAQPRLESVDVTWLDGTTQSFGPFEAGTRPVLRRE